MRGTHCETCPSVSETGIIPAHAGNTTGLNPWTAWTGDHPRACGEHWRRMVSAALRRGSSPRMRGTPHAADRGDLHGGIIPAHAGNTLLARWDVRWIWDHPRACGEHSVHDIGYWSLRGSSPRMRGTPSEWCGSRLMVGIIPAHAGNTGGTSGISTVSGDHPRACGEHHDRGFFEKRILGSSPRMRGTLR